MTIYEVEYRDCSQGDGYGRQYFTSKRGADKTATEIIREHRRRVTARNEAEEIPNNYYNWPADPGEDPDPTVNTLKFTGTPRQMVLKALRYRT